MNSFAQRDTDFNRIELLESVEDPTKFDKVNLCALMMRYSLNQEISARLCNLAANWHYSPCVLMDECKEIWLSGYKPEQLEVSIGSGSDVETES